MSRRLRSSRGFTLPEMLAVVIIIGILAAVASPSFIGSMRDRRVNQAAIQTTDLFRMARTRALANGRATRFVWSSTSGTRGLLSVEQTTDADPTCSATNWGTVSEVNLDNGRYELVSMSMMDSASAVLPTAIVCFNPLGRTYIGPVGGALAAMKAVYRMTVTNTATGVVRTVLFPPNGVARLAL